MNFGSPTMWKNGVLLPTYPTFVVPKIPPFSTFFIGGGIALWANFPSKFLPIFSLNHNNYFNQKLILLHLGAAYSYNYNFLVTQILAFIFDQKTPFSPSTFLAQLTCKNMNFGSPTMWKNGVLLPTYPTFVVLKIPPFSTIFIGGGIALWANFSSKFWSIFSTNCHDYFNQKLILLHLGASYSYYYDFFVIPILAFIFDQNTTSFKGEKKLEIRVLDPFSTTSSKYGTPISSVPSYSPSSAIHTKWYYMSSTSQTFCVHFNFPS
ncbi:hypothetical protein PFUGPA_02706 [Plasmodium falciparum Palo Alto/Uganda]|uniref:Uncharacterized protein n=1 Tax=Plasmodium falciparum (isolate Palo Alto / Uganda) TaxID=57270 RepID=W4J103_PLAFP|nr:hypothetical protein PFUGPA_02706 [Plasmodium falciparum Palo Alto/Uganda]